MKHYIKIFIALIKSHHYNMHNWQSHDIHCVLCDLFQDL